MSSGEDAATSARRLGKNVDAEIEALRERVNDAVRYEDEIKAQIRQFEDEAARWDQQADEAVAQGDDASARYAIEQMQRAEQRAAIAQSDLREHQRVDSGTDPAGQYARCGRRRRAHAQQTDERAGTALPDLSNVLREARETITSLAETAVRRSDELRDPPRED